MENPINVLIFFLGLEQDDQNFESKLAKKLGIPIPNAKLYLDIDNWDKNWCHSLSTRLCFPQEYWYDLLCQYNASKVNHIIETEFK
jgi:hypothetical protein